MSQQSVKYPQALEEAFHTFNHLSRQLADSYHALESRVSSLKEELAYAHDQRFKELTEKERLANRLSALLTALPGGVIVLDKNGCIQEFNPAAVDLLGQPLNGVSWYEVINRAFMPQRDDEHDITLCDGRRVNISTCPLGTEPGQILLITDVSEDRKLQDRLAQSKRLAALGEMAASLAHQIRTPLTSAILYTSNLKRQSLPDNDRLYSGEKIISRLRHLEHVINDMLLYARGVTPGVDTFKIDDLLSDLIVTLDGQLQSMHAKLKICNRGENVTLCGNRQMLLSALINLVVNARQAVGENGCIEVSAMAQDERLLVVSVSDNGCGFSDAAKDRAFEPFFTTKTDGTGLGLAVVLAIISAHKGSVELESNEGAGSIFKLKLPIIEPEETVGSQKTIISGATA